MFTVFVERFTSNGIEREKLFTSNDRNYANEWAIARNRNKSNPCEYYCVMETKDIWF